MYQGEKIPLAVDDPNREEVKPKESPTDDNNDFGIEKRAKEFEESLKSGDKDSDTKFQELVNAMTKKAFFEIKKLDDRLSKIENEGEIEKIEAEKEIIKKNLAQSVAEIQAIASSYNNRGKK